MEALFYRMGELINNNLYSPVANLWKPLFTGWVNKNIEGY
jgi:hypothetical protein